MLDGVHLLVVALGATEDGTKVSLGVLEGSRQNAAVCTRLVAHLVDPRPETPPTACCSSSMAAKRSRR
jgi:hypothetical protein